MEHTAFEEHQHLPDINRLSVLAAAILLAYALTPYIHIPGRVLDIQVPGVDFPLVINFGTFVSILVTLLTLAGTAWLLQSHPHAYSQTRILRHCVIPALTAWGIGVPLQNLGIGLEWWGLFIFGGLLIVFVLTSEYIAIDINDTRHALASISLTAISFALYLILAIALRAAATRLYLLVPTLFIAMSLAALRTLYLRLNERWCWAWALGIAAVISQLAVGLHYLPLTPLQYGLFLTAPAYALTSLAGNWEDNRLGISLWIEPALMLLVVWALALLV